MLDDGSLDVAFALEAEPAEGVQRLELSSEELVIAVSPDHPLAGDGPLSIEALEGSRLIAFQRGSSTRQLIDDALTAAHVEHQIAFEASDLALLRSLVAGGLGVAIFPRSFLERPGPEVCFRPLHPALRMTVALWWVGGRRLSPAAHGVRGLRRRPAGAARESVGHTDPQASRGYAGRHSDVTRSRGRVASWTRSR